MPLRPNPARRLELITVSLDARIGSVDARPAKQSSNKIIYNLYTVSAHKSVLKC